MWRYVFSMVIMSVSIVLISLPNRMINNFGFIVMGVSISNAVSAMLSLAQSAQRKGIKQ